MVSAFYTHAPKGTIDPPKFVPRPNLKDEIEWGPFVATRDAKLAHRLWQLPNDALGSTIPAESIFPIPKTDEAKNLQATHSLASHVYEHLMVNHVRPPTKEESEERWSEVTLIHRGWTLRLIFAPLPELQTQIQEPVLIHGHDVLTSPYWTIARLRQELRNHSLSESGRAAELRKRLYDWICELRGYSFLPRSNLSFWGVDREEDENFTFKLSDFHVLKPLDMYTWAIMLSPYNPAYWLSRAYCHYLQAYYDLALGDAYRAMLLTEVLADAGARNRQPGLYPRIWHAIEQHMLARAERLPADEAEAEIKVLRGPNGINSFMPTVRKALHNIIGLSLAAICSWKMVYTMDNYLKERVIMPFRDKSTFEKRQHVLQRSLEAISKAREEEKLFFYEMPSGNVDGGKPYPYEAVDKDRTASLPLDLMNRNLFKSFPLCKVKADADDNSLRVVAADDIPKGTLIFAEEPSMRGHLAKKRRSDDKTKDKKPRCENCYKILSRSVLQRYRGDAASINKGTHREACKCALQTGDEPMHFCPAGQGQDVTCMEIARGLYHHRACGKDWTWLHDAMRPNVTEWGDFVHYPHLKEENPRKAFCSPRVMYTNEIAGTMMSFLLRDVFDTTLKRREQTGDSNLMAHELDELLSLEDHNSWQDSWFPFTWEGNIKVPFDILLQLGVNIFQDFSFDTWVIQTVLRKLIVNAVPWDKKWRGSVERVQAKWKVPNPTMQKRMVNKKQSLRQYDPMFETLYLFSGFSMFNHACRGGHNALWGYDNVIPNRVLVWATEDIPISTEIRIPYKHRQMTSEYAIRVLGKKCKCPLCQTSPRTEDWDVEEGSEPDSDDNEGSDYDDSTSNGNGNGNDGNGGHGNGRSNGTRDKGTTRGIGRQNGRTGSNQRRADNNNNNNNTQYERSNALRSPNAVSSRVLPGIDSSGVPTMLERRFRESLDSSQPGEGQGDQDNSPNYEPTESAGEGGSSEEEGFVDPDLEPLYPENGTQNQPGHGRLPSELLQHVSHYPPGVLDPPAVAVAAADQAAADAHAALDFQAQAQAALDMMSPEERSRQQQQQQGQKQDQKQDQEQGQQEGAKRARGSEELGDDSGPAKRRREENGQ